MRPEEQRSFGADDPVARYWLHNCVGFRVRGMGVVNGIDGDGTVLTVKRLGVTTRVSRESIESIDPWRETIVLRRRRERPPREEPHAAVTAAGTATAITTAWMGRFFALVARLLLALAALVRSHWPGARERAARIAAAVGAVGEAYALEAARAYREQAAATKAWRDGRRRGEWGDESPLTRAGDDQAGARHEEKDRALPSKRVGR
jgi:hypothetical protein